MSEELELIAIEQEIKQAKKEEDELEFEIWFNEDKHKPNDIVWLDWKSMNIKGIVKIISIEEIEDTVKSKVRVKLQKSNENNLELDALVLTD